MSLGSLSLTNFDHALKTLYSDEKVLSLIYKDNPALARVKKRTDFKGRNKVLDVLFAPGAGGGAGFAAAQANVAGAQGAAFTVTRASQYSIRQLDNETIESSEGDEGALISAIETEADTAIQSLRNALGMAMFGDGSGQIGQVSSPGASQTLTLVTAADVVNFFLDQKLVFAEDSSKNLRHGGATLTVDGRDEANGTVHTTANVSTISGIANNDAIFTESNYTAANDKKMIVGFGGWNPATAPVAGGGDAFFGKDRADDAVRLSGWRFTDAGAYAGYTTEQAVRLLCTYIGRSGWNPDCVYMSFKRLDDLITELGSKVQYSKVTVPINKGKQQVAEVGFDTVRIHTPGGTVECIPDRSCLEDTIFVQTTDTWELWTLGQTVKWISDVSGARTRTRESADGVEMRLVSRGNLVCKAPGANGRFDWS
ncbi:MAG: hypothetical protein CMK74_00170 [Pseudomonadales bacterium]|nr:hypothetical protein [Pseudomonadales bacterium]